MKKAEKKLISTKPSLSEVSDLATRALSSLAASVPLAYEPIKFLFASGALFTAQSINKMGCEVQDFIASKKAKEESEREVPYRRLYETLKLLHNSSVLDDEFIEALRNLHILTFAKDTNSEEVAETYILLETARQLSGSEISIILAAYRIHDNLYTRKKMDEIQNAFPGLNLNSNHVGVWTRVIAKALGNSLPEYVESRQTHLEELRLITLRNHSQFGLDGRGNDFSPAGKFRLTDFGYKLAQYITKGDNLFKAEVEK